MTIPSTARKAGPLLGTGAQTAWPFTFKVFAESDIAVTIADSLGVETALVLNTDYSVALNANQDTSPGGTVTYPISGSPLASGSVLSIVGDLDYDQPLDLPSGGNFNPLALENELDRLTMQIQQLKEQVGRAIQVSVTTDSDVSLPAPAASQLIGWDATGTSLENVPIESLATAVGYGTFTSDTFTGDGSTTQFTLSSDPATIGNVVVVVDGLTLTPVTDFTLVSGVVAFVVAPSLGAEIVVRHGEALPSGVANAQDVNYLPAGTGAVATTVQAKLRESVSVIDYKDAAAIAGDWTSAINAASAYAHTLTAGTTTDPYSTVTLGGVDVYFPPGSYPVTGKLMIYENVGFIGEGNRSSVIYSTYNGNILEVQPSATYNVFGVSIENIGIIGDRTKASQTGLALMRLWEASIKNVLVMNCGGKGILMRECLMNTLIGVESQRNVGAGITITGGVTSWSDSTPSNLPSNANSIINGHFAYNDAAGISLINTGTGGANSTVFYGGGCEYNYRSSASGVGANIELSCTNYHPNVFNDMSVEDTKVLHHVYINQAVGTVTKFNNLMHIANGAATYPLRAVKVNSGVTYISYAQQNGNSYPTTNGSTAPFEITKASANIYVTNCAGVVSDGKFVCDETGATTGLQNNARMENHGFGYGVRQHYNDFGEAGPSFYQSGQTQPYLDFSTYYKGIQFGGGVSAPDVVLGWSSAGILAIDKTLLFDGATGKTIKYANPTANGTVATTMGNVGPTGSTAGNPQGWLRINVAGTDRYIPYW